MDNCKNLLQYELIQVPTGRHYKVTTGDITFFTYKTKEILNNYIKENDIVAMFLSMGDMNFNHLILYNACIECGACVIRCSISDIDRQIPVTNNISADFIIIGDKSLRHVKDKVKYKKHILYEPIDRMNYESDLKDRELAIYEFQDVPGFLMLEHNKDWHCPGYSVQSMGNQLVLTSNDIVEGFQIKNMRIDTDMDLVLPLAESIQNLYTRSFIRAQISFVLSNKLNMKTEHDEIILDSLGLIELLVHIEEVFNLLIPIHNISKTDFQSLDRLNSLICKLVLEGE